MSRSNWLHIVAFGGCLAAAVVLSCEGHAQQNNTEAAQQTKQQEKAPNQLRSAPVPESPKADASTDQQKPKASVYKSDCGDTPDHDEADLCEQRRMAKAAEDAVWWAAFQSKLGVLGFAAVILSLIFTGWAAVAASRAAKAAEESLTKVQRPYIFIFGVRECRASFNKEYDGFVPYTVANYGQTPAVIEKNGARLSLGDLPEIPEQENEDHPLVISPVMEPGEKLDKLYAQSTFWLDSGGRVIDLRQSPSGEILQAVPNIPAGKSLFLWIKISYRGPLTGGHETSACWRYDQIVCQFISYGGEEYNYSR